MPERLLALLKKRAERSWLNLLEQVEAVTPEEALRDRHPNWPGHEYGIGQDGSIAGIVYHVAAWKQMTLPLFQPEGQVIPIAAFDRAAAPDPDDWPGLVAWLKRVGTAWNAELAGLPNEVFMEMRDWEGTIISVAHYVTDMYEHDVQHAAQIEYLRQRNAAERV